MWVGMEEEGHSGQNFAQTPGGLVLARFEVRDYGLWKKSWIDEKAWNQSLPGSITKAIPCRLFRLASNPGVVIVSYELSDINQVRDFTTSMAEKNALEAAGVAHLDFWVGTNLEEGTFTLNEA